MLEIEGRFDPPVINPAYFEARYDDDPVVMALVEAYAALRAAVLEERVLVTKGIQHFMDEIRDLNERAKAMAQVQEDQQEALNAALERAEKLAAELERERRRGRSNIQTARLAATLTSIDGERVFQWVADSWPVPQDETPRTLRLGEPFRDPRKKRGR